MNRVDVTKTFLPPKQVFDEYVDKIWATNRLTNNGPLLKEFESKMSAYLGVSNFHLVANGTLALQLAIRSLEMEQGEIITTPFSYVASASAIMWEGYKPIFADIDPDTLCIDPTKIEESITEKTKAILAVHVFGNPCDIERIESIAKRKNLKVIYDGAHAFAVKHGDKSLLSYGDVSTCSFHSTKLFHTIEGGCVIARDDKVNNNLELMKKFGHHGDDHYMLGINAKASEFQAAMGLSNLRYIKEIVEKRRHRFELYKQLLGTAAKFPVIAPKTEYNYAYFPAIFDSEKTLLRVVGKLNDENIYPRRYFFPSLNRLPYLTEQQDCPVSEDISRRILCLPFHSELDEKDMRKICEIINGEQHG